MMTLDANAAVVLDNSALDFIQTFVAHVKTMAGQDQSRAAMIARVEVLLLAALTSEGGTSSAWNMLHRTIADIVPKKSATDTTRTAHEYLQSFVAENGDLADDRTPRRAVVGPRPKRATA